MNNYYKIISIFEYVRDIPYGDIGSRNPDDILEKNMGTCSGKHALLKKLYSEAGIKCKDYIAMHKFIDLPIEYPKNLKEILSKNNIIDPHNFIKINVNNRWVTVDATWDMPLKKLGFPVNINWDGKSDMDICVKAFRTNEVKDPNRYKEEELSKLDKKTQKNRKIFLKELSMWLAENR